MSQPFLVTHPVPCLHRPPRARTDRFAYLSGATAVEIGGFDRDPVEIARHASASIVAADGRAWTRARDPSGLAPLTADGLRDVLASRDGPELNGMAFPGHAHHYLWRSPLCRSGPGGRLGSIEASPQTGAIGEGAQERASEAVRGFVADRIRLHGGEVYLRYDRILLAMPMPVGFMTQFPLNPRTSVGAAAHRTARGYQGMEHNGGGWDEHNRIHAGLLGDDDAIWLANVMPERAIAVLGRPALTQHLGDEDLASVRTLRASLAALVRQGETLSVTGDGLRPALGVVLEASQTITRLSQEALDRTRMLVHAEDARSFAHLTRTIRWEVLPRVVARQFAPGLDDDALSLLAP